MPWDIDAEVIGNRRLTADYNVVSLAAPEIAAATEPGQFVMVKPGHGWDPLLRRPFSVFEILRDSSGAPSGVSILSKRIGVTTRALFDVEPGDRVQCLGPLGRPFTLPEADTQVWMVAGGVGLAPFVTVTEALAPKGVPLTLFYGGRSEADLFHLDFFARHRVRTVLATEDGSKGESRTRHACRSNERSGRSHRLRRSCCMRAAPSECSRPSHGSRNSTAGPAKSPWNA